MVYPPYAAPFPTPTDPPVLGAQQRAILTALAQRPGRVVTREELAARLGLPQLSPRRADVLVAGINDTLGPDTIVEVPRRGLKMTPYVDRADRHDALSTRVPAARRAMIGP